jgi:lipoprotein-releasing system permease protein
MRYAFFIGLRYLRARRQEAFISLITVIATAGVAIGVMTLVIVLSVMTGFEEDLRDRILVFNPHVLVMSYGGSVEDYATLLDRVDAFPEVVAAAPFVHGQAMISTGQSAAGALVRGIPPGQDGVTDFAGHLEVGNKRDLETRHPVAVGEDGSRQVELPAVILGSDLARQLGVSTGNPISLISPVGLPTLIGMVPRVKRFVVTGLFDSGMTEYDESLVFMGLEDAQRFFRLDGGVTGIEVRLKDLYQAHEVAERMSAQIGFPYRIRDWMEMNHNLFSALTLEKTVYFIVLLLIVLVAGFNIIATLIMVVMEKRKDIAILKSMGATRLGIGAIFVFKGLIIGSVGTALGNLAGYTACRLLERYQFIDLPPDVFYVSTVPVKMHPEFFVTVTATSLVICLLATLYPARQAARLAPVEVIRYE